MNIVRIQGDAEKRAGIYYELDTDGPFLGEGGMGRVYKGFCVDMRTGQRSVVAIKAVHESIQSPQLLERARREASIQIENENLIKMYGFIENPEQLLSGAWVKRYYMPMELLVGVNLDDMMRGVTTDQHGLRIPFADELYAFFNSNKVVAIAQIAKALLAGIMAMHNKGFIHRDIDPSNVMITLDRKIKLIDFGICKQINTLATTDKHLTSTGTFIGKVNYAAPELVLGDVKSQNQTTDIYAIGVLLYQLYTGRLPFEGSDEHVLYCHLRKPMPVKDIKHPVLKKIIKKATEKSQDKRYASAAEMIVDLERLLSRTHGGDKVEVEKKKLPLGGIIAGAAAVAAAVAAIVFWPEKTPEPVLPPPPPPTLSELYAQAVAKIAPGSPDSLVQLGRKEIYKLAKDSLHTKSIMSHYAHVISQQDTLKWAEAYALVERLAVRDSLPEAMYECAMASTYLPKFDLPEKKLYGFINNVDLEKANAWLDAVIERDSTNYKALYYALINYVSIGRNATLDDEHKEIMKRYYTAFVQLTDMLQNEETQKYRKESSVIKNTMIAWGIIK